MERLRSRLEELRKRGRAGLIVYLMAGDPDLDTTFELLLQLQDLGVDAVELGVPFSDPIADGPVIQRAAERALASGTNLPAVLELVSRFRGRADLPVVLFTYVNPVLRLGLDRFPGLAVSAGADAALLLDLPPEEADGYAEASREAGLETVFLVAPTSTEERVRRASALATGFLYCVSRTGVTGERERLPEGLEGMLARVRRNTDLPVAVGFGISRREHVRQASRLADAVVVGSAVVRRISESHRSELPQRLASLIADLRAGLE